MDNIDYAQLQASREINNDNEDFLSLDKSFPTFERLLQKLGEDEYKNLLQEFNQNPLAFQAAYQVLYQYINSTSNNRKEEE